MESAAAPDPEAPSAERLAETLEALCRAPRLAGSEESRLAADYAAEVFQQAGLEVERFPYWCYLPRQTGQSLQVRHEERDWQALDLREFGYEEDPRSLSQHIPPMHGLTGAGRAEGVLWYAGYGTEAEFLELERRYGREALEGGIALIRYGAIYRGLKVANAEAAGFAGALLYTNAEDDGFGKGEVLPAGPWRPSSGIQRGSVYNADGDPLTPGRPALEHADRIPVEQAEGLVHIPSLPISSGNAHKLLNGAEHALGRLPSSVRLWVEQDPSLVRVENVLGRIPGSKKPEEWVLVGAHRDGWGFGATDNGTGSTVLLETARVFGQALKRGWRPERTLIFATWDAEEWGLVGSTEWVEHHRVELMEKAVAYLNLDVVATGPRFGASCTPGMATITRLACAEAGVTAPSHLGVPGGGSDHVPFLELAGVEVLNFGFHGGSGVYHSALDTPFLVQQHLDPEMKHHRRAAGLTVRILTHLSRAKTLVDGRLAWLRQANDAVARMSVKEDQQPLIDGLRTQLQETMDRLRAAAPSASQAYRFHRSFLPPTGASLLWRSLGYGSAWFPELAQALEQGRGEEEAAQLTRILEGIGRD